VPRWPQLWPSAALVAWCLTGAAVAQSVPGADPSPSLSASRAPTPPIIDGRLDEAPWQAAAVAGDFRQYEPAEGAPATERTEVRVLYDNTAVYVGVRLYDSEPARIVARMSRRDEDPDADRFTFYVDALHDRLTGAAFEVSAAGAQRDGALSNDTIRDNSWDAVWEAAVSIDEQGWNAELRIPLSQLRFLRAERQTWGFNVERFIYRKNERVWVALVPKAESGLASRMATLTGIDGIEPRRALELTPYTVLRSEFMESAGLGNPFNDGSRHFGATGVDLKYAVRSNVIFNATVNPDFGQVEIDPAVVNLGAFETFFPERRPFFIEGHQIFSNFGNLGATNMFGFNRSEPNVIHTRRIGRFPQGSTTGDFVDIPSSTTILAAAKLTGKTTDGWSFGLLDAVTDREHGRTASAGSQSRSEIEPVTNYFAGRLLKEFGGGRSGVGAIATSVNREFGPPSLRQRLPGRAHVAGFDGYHLVDRAREWVINGQLLVSEVAGDPAAIEHLQFAPQRYLQRTATPHVTFDPSRTLMRGWNGHLNFNRNQGAWTANASVWAVSPGFESSDMGFHYDGDRWGNHFVLTWKQIEPDRISRDRNVMVGKFYVWNFDHTKLSDGVMAFPRVTFLNYWNIQGAVGWFRQGQDDRLTRGGPPSLSLASRSASLTVNSDSRKRVVLHVNGGREWGDSGADQGNGGVTVDWKPSSRVSLSSGPAYTHNITPAQYVTTTDDAAAIATGGKRYVFARLQQKQLSIDTRINVLFSARASLQMFMQPLIVVGDYMDFKSLAAPRTFTFDPYAGVDADPSFNFKSLRANAIFRWEWRLGSTLYIAWTQQRQDLSNPGTFDAGRDLTRVFTGRADNILMVKVSRWFGR
jgi:hypothetical protein